MATLQYLAHNLRSTAATNVRLYTLPELPIALCSVPWIRGCLLSRNARQTRPAQTSRLRNPHSWPVLMTQDSVEQRRVLLFSISGRSRNLVSGMLHITDPRYLPVVFQTLRLLLASSGCHVLVTSTRYPEVTSGAKPRFHVYRKQLGLLRNSSHVRGVSPFRHVRHRSNCT